MLELLGSKETSFPQILKDRLHVQLGMSHNPCTFGSYTIQPVPLSSAVKLWHSFRGGQWLPAFSPYFIWATRLSSTHLCNVTTQMLPSPLFFSVVFHSFLQKALLVFPVRSWASVVPIVELCSALFPLCRSLELFSEMRICFQGISHVLKTVIVIKSLKSRTSSHNSESLLWSKQKDLSLEKQLAAKWHLQNVLWYHLPSRPVWLRKWSSVVESSLRTHRLRAIRITEKQQHNNGVDGVLRKRWVLPRIVSASPLSPLNTAVVFFFVIPSATSIVHSLSRGEGNGVRIDYNLQNCHLNDQRKSGDGWRDGSVGKGWHTIQQISK